MKHSYIFYWFLLSLIILSSCDMIGQNQTTSETQSDVTLEETLWKLVNFQDENGQKSDSGSSEITLIFHENGTLSGKSSANEYESSYSIQNVSLVINVVGSTEVGEPDGSKYWDYYLPALKDVHSYKIHDNELKLYYGENNQALIFEATAM
jgi:heat shock protein HslJ